MPITVVMNEVPVELHIFHTPKDLFARMPERERTFLLHLLHAANEINILVKMFRFTSYAQEGEPDFVTYATMIQGMTLGRILAAKLSDAARLIHFGYMKADLDGTYAPELRPEASDSLRRMMNYFADRLNLITIVRNGFSSHYDSARLSKHFDTAPENEKWQVILAGHDSNCLYLAPEILVLHALMSEIHTGSREEAYDRLVQDTTVVASWFKTFATGFLMVAVDRHLGGFTTWDQNRRQIALEGGPSFYEFRIPFFMETDES